MGVQEHLQQYYNLDGMGPDDIAWAARALKRKVDAGKGTPEEIAAVREDVSIGTAVGEAGKRSVDMAHLVQNRLTKGAVDLLRGGADYAGIDTPTLDQVSSGYKTATDKVQRDYDYENRPSVQGEGIAGQLGLGAIEYAPTMIAGGFGGRAASTALAGRGITGVRNVLASNVPEAAGFTAYESVGKGEMPTVEKFAETYASVLAGHVAVSKAIEGVKWADNRFFKAQQSGDGAELSTSYLGKELAEDKLKVAEQTHSTNTARAVEDEAVVDDLLSASQPRDVITEEGVASSPRERSAEDVLAAKTEEGFYDTPREEELAPMEAQQQTAEGTPSLLREEPQAQQTRDPLEIEDVNIDGAGKVDNLNSWSNKLDTKADVISDTIPVHTYPKKSGVQHTNDILGNHIVNEDEGIFKIVDDVNNQPQTPHMDDTHAVDIDDGLSETTSLPNVLSKADIKTVGNTVVDGDLKLLQDIDSSKVSNLVNEGYTGVNDLHFMTGYGRDDIISASIDAYDGIIDGVTSKIQAKYGKEYNLDNLPDELPDTIKDEINYIDDKKQGLKWDLTHC